MSAHLIRGPMLAEAACLAERAYRDLLGMLLRLDAAGIEPADGHVEMIGTAGIIEIVGDISIVQFVEAFGDLATSLVSFADDFGHAEVARRGRAAA